MLAQSPITTSTHTLTGFTEASRKASLSAGLPGKLIQIFVKNGQTVKAGDKLAQLDDTAQLARVVAARQQAASTAAIQRAKARQSVATFELQRLRDLDSKSAADHTELRRAEHEVAIADIELLDAQEQHEMNVRQAELQEAILAQLSVRAPFDGYITRVWKEAGESVDTQEKIVDIVQLDPLSVVVDCPVIHLHRLPSSGTLLVQPQGIDQPARSATIDWVNRAVDPASQTVRLGLSIPNRDGGWPSGLRVQVVLPEKKADKEQGKPQQEPATRKGE